MPPTTPPAMAPADVWEDERCAADCAEAVGARAPVLVVSALVPAPVVVPVVSAVPLDVVVVTSSNLMHEAVRIRQNVEAERFNIRVLCPVKRQIGRVSLPLRGHDQRVLHVLQGGIAVKRDIVFKVCARRRNMRKCPRRLAVQLKADVNKGRSIRDIIGDDAIHPDGGTCSIECEARQRCTESSLHVPVKVRVTFFGAESDGDTVTSCHDLSKVSPTTG